MTTPRIGVGPGVGSWLAAVLLPLVVFGVDLGTPSLWDPDEGRHAEIAREMLLTGDWLTPKLNFDPYREKTPTFYWLVAGAFALLGERSETAARLAPAGFAIFGAWMTALWGASRLGRRAGTLGALVLATSAGYVGIGRLVFVEAVYAALLAAALFAMCDALTGARKGFPWIFWTALAGATAARGPVALLLAALVAIGFLGFVREPRRLLALHPLTGIGLISALLVPLAWMTTASDPAYLGEFFWRWNVGRFLGMAEPGSHVESPLYYLWMLPLLLLPWVVILPWSLFDSFRAQGEDRDETRAFLLAWTGVVVVFFTISATKLPSYVLPALFPLSLLVGSAVTRLLARPRPWSILDDPLLFGGGIIFVGLVVSPIVGYRIVRNEFPMYAEKTAYLLLLLPFAAPGLAAVALRNRRAVIVSLVATSAVFVVALYHYGSGTVSAYNSMEVPATLVERQLPEDALVLAYRTTSHSFSFYSARPVRGVETIEEVSTILNGEAPIALLTKERFLGDVRRALRRGLYVWWEGDSRKMLLANRPSPPGADSRVLLPVEAGFEPAPNRSATSFASQ